MNPRAGGKADLGWGVCLALGTVVYLQFWPHDLNWFDESVLLYEAKRVMEGDVPYRDFFEIVTPGAWYVMAGVFRLFGPSVETARTTMSILHGLSVTAIYLCGRALRLPRFYAALPAIAYVAICYPNCAYATPHWFATFLDLVLLLGLLIAPTGPSQGRWLFVVGMLASLLLTFQQQRGFAIAAGIPLIILADCLLERRLGGARRPAMRLLGWYLAGGVVGGVPVIAYVLAVPGFEPAYKGLVDFPLFDYSSYNQVRWGEYAQFPTVVLPWLFRYLPVLLPVGAAAVVIDLRRGAKWEAFRRRAILLCFCLLSIPTIFNRPDYLHIALIAPFFFILAADLLDWALQRPSIPSSRQVRFTVAAGLMAALAYQGRRNLLEQRAMLPLSRATAFGEVSFVEFRRRSLFIHRVGQVMEASHSKEIFVYPYYPGIYLLTGTHNPTRYSLLIPGYSPPEHFREVISTLESKQTPFVAYGLSEVQEPNDFTKYLASAYEEVPLHMRSAYRLFRRKEP